MKKNNEKTTKKDNTVIMSDKFLGESGVEGGKVIGEHIALGSFIVGIPLLIIGILASINILFDMGFPTNNAIIILVILVIVIGLLLTIGGYNIYREKHS